jgi:hypothetical protein
MTFQPKTTDQFFSVEFSTAVGVALNLVLLALVVSVVIIIIPLHFP